MVRTKQEIELAKKERENNKLPPFQVFENCHVF